VAKPFTLALGVVLFVVGAWGLATGGHDHALIVFGVNLSHNLVHLVSGAVAVFAAMRGGRAAILFCLAFGVVYGAVAVCGFCQVAAVGRFLNLNTADNFLHLAISAACLAVGGFAKG
jgi:hypothetical protein